MTKLLEDTLAYRLPNTEILVTDVSQWPVYFVDNVLAMIKTSNTRHMTVAEAQHRGLL